MEAKSSLKTIAAATLLTTNPIRAQMAMQSSSHKVLLLRTCSSFRKTPSISLLCFRRSYSSDEFHYSSKRRARGPVMAAKKASEGAKQGEGRYKHTVDLPKTAFGMRANSAVREPEIQKLWDENQVFKRVSDRNNGVSFFSRLALNLFNY
ncbi:hypothetical protein RHGRI_012551 [Rhododendron griersonianum]|uniref:Uncharacterized protein n=1 Tax=Rhododendron griersonianum TaxID=479676 RepID=A0AAV6KSL2_9ERIC|nr:hypothetical protein RHGRI_012551 [Rhododendron griersonianum]KAG5555050.1 hypothetical protein RHGRI_012551 [Rhododendron griersonianum]